MRTVLGAVLALLGSVLDALLPLRERTRRTRSLSVEDVPLSPTAHTLLGASITTLMQYEGAAADIIQSLKYDGSGHAARLCAAIIADYLHEELASRKLFSQKKVLLVPVPLHPSRQRERGFNQMESVLRALPKEFSDGTISSIQARIIHRVRATRQQTRLSRNERLSNVAGAFDIANAEHVRGTSIYLIDDVTTTGATLVNAATPLRRAGAHVTLVALARA